MHVPNDAVVAGAVTTVDELRGQTTAAPIFPNEQIPLDASRDRRGEHARHHPGQRRPRPASADRRASTATSARATTSSCTPRSRRERRSTKDTLKQLLSPAADPEVLRRGQRRRRPPRPGAGAGVVLPADFTVTLDAASRCSPSRTRRSTRRRAARRERRHDAGARPDPEDASQLVFATTQAHALPGPAARRRTRTATRPRHGRRAARKVVGVG